MSLLEKCESERVKWAGTAQSVKRLLNQRSTHGRSMASLRHEAQPGPGVNLVPFCIAYIEFLLV
jgi:hypothetical protein